MGWLCWLAAEAADSLTPKPGRLLLRCGGFDRWRSRREAEAIKDGPAGLRRMDGRENPHAREAAGHSRTSTAQRQWNLSIQHELPGGIVGQISYVGRRGTRLFRAYDINQINADPILGSFNSMKQNLDRGCRPDGT